MPSGVLNGVKTTITSDSQGGSSIGYENIPFSAVWSWSRFGVRTPGFYQQYRNFRYLGKDAQKRFRDHRKMKQKARRLDLPMNPFRFDLSRESGDNGSSFHFVYNKVYKTWVLVTEWGNYGRGLTVPGIPPDWHDQADTLALAKINTKFKDQSVNLGVFVGEGRQTINLFANAAKRISGSFRSMKHGDFRGAAEALGGVGLPPALLGNSGRYIRNSIIGQRAGYRRALANGWLELKYGWQPLMSDVHGALEHLANSLYRAPRFKETSSASKKESVIVFNGGVDFNTSIAYNKQSTAKYVVYFSGDENHSPSALGVVNPLSIAWELVPYSFVADWFIPIGNYLNNLDATSGLNFVKGCKTVFQRSEAIKTYIGRSYQDENVSVSNSYSVVGRGEILHCQRTPLGSFPTQKFPDFKPLGKALNVPHIENALALLQQTFKR